MPGPTYGDFKFPRDFGFSGSDGVQQVRGYSRGGKVKPAKVAKVMHEFKHGELHSGSKQGPKVTNPKQAVAIAMSEAGQSRKKGVPAHSSKPRIGS